MTNAELISEAQAFVKTSPLLDAYTVTTLYKDISEIDGGQDAAEAMLNNWLTAFKEKQHENFAFENFWNQPIHPAIQAAFDAEKAKAQTKSTIFEACKHIATQNGWGQKQEATLKTATVQDFEWTIRTLEASDLRVFMLKFLEMCVQAEHYKKNFGSATDNFLVACRNIYSDQTAPRLSKLIDLLLKDAKLQSQLNPPSAAAPEFLPDQ